MKYCPLTCLMVTQGASMVALFPLTLIPSNRDNALNGLRARRVLRDLMGPISEYPSVLAMRLIKET